LEDLFLGSQWSIILGYRRLSVKSLIDHDSAKKNKASIFQDYGKVTKVCLKITLDQPFQSWDSTGSFRNNTIQTKKAAVVFTHLLVFQGIGHMAVGTQGLRLTAMVLILDKT